MNITLGRTNIEICKDGFGALPIQRTEKNLAVKILRRAFDIGLNFFDTATAYTDSEEKLGYAFGDYPRKNIIIATKARTDISVFWENLENSLTMLKTDYIDIYQIHNPTHCPKPGDESGLYDAMLEAKKQGKIRFIGISNHRLSVAKTAVESGLYDTLQFPFNYLSNANEIDLVNLCAEKNVGFIAMKALSGGLITDISTAHSWIHQFSNVVPIWGIQYEYELEELAKLVNQNSEVTIEQQKRIDQDRKELSGDFCRGCSYCMPCPKDIPINPAARMPLFLRRSPVKAWLFPDFQAQMENIKSCIHCGHCTSNCPYNLNVPELLEKSYIDYQTFLK